MMESTASTVLVVGGAGYIGSHMVKLLASRGHSVVVLDDLSTGHRTGVNGTNFIQGNISDRNLIQHIFASSRIDAVLHFASFIQVGESVRDPAKYYSNNVAATLILLEEMLKYQVQRLVFSSSAAVYGEPACIPIDEMHPKKPLNPYGQSKWMVEQILLDYAKAYDLRSCIFRYFNAAGADPEGTLGECHEPETHLIPLVLMAASGRLDHVTVFGNDYDTPDRTCIRDYVHVQDICEAHLAGLAHLATGGKGGVYNLGSGTGYSVNEVIEVARLVTGRNIPIRYAARRPGDPARLVADSTRARRELGWQPRYAALCDMISHAWQWERKLAEM